MSGEWPSEISARTLTAQADALRANGRFDAALKDYSRALALDPTFADARRGMIAILQMAHTTQFHPVLAALIVDCLADHMAYHQPLGRAAALQIRLRYGLDHICDPDGAVKSELIAAVETDRLVLDLLARTIVVDASLERFFTRLRRRLLFDSRVGGMELRSALAVQCSHNEYSWWAEPDETARVDTLRSGLSQDQEFSVATAAMYVPPHELPIAAALADQEEIGRSAALRPLVRMVLERRVEQAIRSRIESFGDITDPVSRAVGTQYEENPYPRWIQLPYMPHGDAFTWIRRKYPHMAPPSSGRPLQVLCAGCGTGRHALCLGAGYQGAEITAFDLSRRSLAYAIRRARELEYKNVRFLQGDILAVDRLGMRFDVIESVGVLHHMSDPATGLARLTTVLKPGGLIRVGLYGEGPRAEVVEARRRISALGLDGSVHSVRLFRHLLLTDPDFRDLTALSDRVDFFSISGTRDLLFHVEEHRFTIDRIRELLAEAKLEFIGWENVGEDGAPPDTGPAIASRYRAAYPADSAMRDLDNWAALERREPNLFRRSGFSGYIFWAQRRP